MNKLECLEFLINKKIDLTPDFKITMNSKEANKNTVFFAINSGNEYVNEAENLGAFVIYDDKDKKIENGFLVENTVEFMQKFAKLYRDERNFDVIAITGSNGKTTVKDILYSTLKQLDEKVYKTQGNYNNHIGLPFTILSANDDDKVLLLEMGMSNLGEIDLLGNIAKPDYAIITNIGQSHLQYLKTEENVFKAKTEIIPHTRKKVIVNGLDKFLKNLKDVILVDIEDIETNLLGIHNKLNVSLAKTVLIEMGYSNLDFNNISLTEGRFQIIEKENFRFINDAYNASPLSMRASIETFSNIFNDDYKIICLGDMLELGNDEIKYHENLYSILEKTRFDRLILHGKLMKNLFNKITEEHGLKISFGERVNYLVQFFENKDDIVKSLNKINTQKRVTILLKGSRSMKMDEIMKGVK